MPERFSASVAARHMSCHASANLELAIPNWTPPVVDEDAGAKGVGTAKHAMLEPIMQLSAVEVAGFAAVLTYVAELRATRRFNVLVEQSITATWLDSQPSTTVDLVLYTKDELHVIDFKFGRIPVEVEHNEQLLYYATCFAPLAPKAKGATLHILQPHANNLVSWFADASVLAQFMVDAQFAERQILAGSTAFGPGDHCKFCPANPHSRGDKGKPLCPAMLSILYPDQTNEAEILAF